VDTHVGRLAGRLGLSSDATPDKIERALMNVLPRDEWRFTNHALIAHGRAVCQARKPNCGDCVLVDLCPTGSSQATES
jgi:endonuclease-3